MLVQTAWSGVRAKGSYSRAKFYGLKSRRGPGKAIIAVAASMLVANYHMLQRGVPYRDLGADHFVESHGKERIARGCVRRLEHLGYKVELHEAA